MKLHLLVGAFLWNAKAASGFSALATLILFWAVIWCGIGLVLRSVSGWGLLARRFRATEPWNGKSWGWQSARFRGFWRYNRNLRFGANPESLYLSANVFFLCFHPALRIPWSEIEVKPGKIFFGIFEVAHLRIGRQEQVNVRIFGKLVSRLREAAGQGWPLYQAGQIGYQTEQIGTYNKW
jgi:hypothetical protein